MAENINYQNLKVYYRNQPPVKFLRNKFFCSELQQVYESEKQLRFTEYALQLLWIAEVVWIENTRVARSRIQDLIIDELATSDLMRVISEYRFTYKSPWEMAIVILITVTNRLWFPEKPNNKYEIMRLKKASSITFAGRNYTDYCNQKLKDNFDSYARGRFFPLPKELFKLDLSVGEIAVYAYLMSIEDRRTFSCVAKYSTIAEALSIGSKNTVAKYLRLLDSKGLISMRQTTVMNKSGQLQNGCMKFKIHPIQNYVRRFEEIKSEEFRRSLKKAANSLKLAKYDKKHQGTGI